MVDFARYRFIRHERRGRILTLTLDRPDKLNAVDAALHAELATIFSDAADDPGSDVIVLTGAGRAFCSGGDIPWMQTMIDEGFGQTAREAKRIIFSLLDCEKPIIARSTAMRQASVRHSLSSVTSSSPSRPRKSAILT